MKRRPLLATAGAAACSFTGCLGALSREEDVEYETCPNTIVRVGSLPDPAETAVTAALEDGSYETDGELVLTRAIDVDESYLRWHDRYYAAVVERDNGTTRLRLEETAPPADPVRLENGTDEDATLEVRIEYEGEPLLERTVTVPADESIALEGPDYRFGSYRAEIELPARSERIVDTWTVDEGRFQAFVDIDDDDLRVAQGYAQVAGCEWNENGDLVDS
ncbi:hypothetical protein [Halopiger aswanensis]|uniref:Uncharacterized protein n=1 Tax=Halopiger aswanensis TaxID=148449 RepID=A0A419WJU6_9EURY|nr:hypothetical protein [Halopiger aswanensis]RKD95717.1 hypothetical protein ATJ93_2579 [Halopiger aswanensis]